MFGHRWLRETDYDNLISWNRTLIGQANELLHEKTLLLERLIDAEAAKRSAMSMRDTIVTRVNQLEEESAMLRHKLTGLPQLAPKIERGSPLRASEIGAGVDLFEDVGDDKAKDLREAGLLHEERAALPFPSAAALTEHLN